MRCLYIMNICTRDGDRFYNTRLPKGTIYGEDTRGAFYCVEYRVKGYSGDDKPILMLHRLIKNNWEETTEANATTEAILGLYYKAEEERETHKICDLQTTKKPRPIRNINIVKCYGFKYYGRELPKGAIYGQDRQGLFFCEDYRVKGETGFHKGFPRLKIYRPAATTPFDEVQKNRRDKWRANIEANDTTLAILELFEQNEELCDIDYSLQIKQMAKKQELRPVITTKMIIV